MNTTDVIAVMRAASAITDIVNTKIFNARVPTLDPSLGEVNTPFIWIEFRSQTPWECNTPEVGEQPMAKQFDIECVDTTASGSEALRQAVYNTLHGYQGTPFTMLTATDQGDDYVTRSVAADAGVFVGSLLLNAI